MYNAIDGDGTELFADDLELSCASWQELVARNVRRWVGSVHVELSLRQVVAGQGTDIHQVCQSESRVYGGHNNVCYAVVTFSHGPPRLHRKSECGLLDKHGRLVMTFRHGRRMVLCHWIAEGSDLVGID